MRILCKNNVVTVALVAVAVIVSAVFDIAGLSSTAVARGRNGGGNVIVRDHRNSPPIVRDHRRPPPAAAPIRRPIPRPIPARPIVRDHRQPVGTVIVRDHRTRTIVRDHRK